MGPCCIGTNNYGVPMWNRARRFSHPTIAWACILRKLSVVFHFWNFWRHLKCELRYFRIQIFWGFQNDKFRLGWCAFQNSTKVLQTNLDSTDSGHSESSLFMVHAELLFLRKLGPKALSEQWRIFIVIITLLVIRALGLGHYSIHCDCSARFFSFEYP